MERDILFLPISGPKGASSRYRLLQFLPALEAEGLSYWLHLPPPISGSGLKRLLDRLRERHKIDAMASASRAVFIQKRLLPASWIDRLSNERPLLFDFDDAIFTSPSGKRSRLTQRRVEQRLQHVLTASKIVIAGNQYLGDYAAQYAKHVSILPTVLDTARYPAKSHERSEQLVIGWIGHSVNHPYLLEMSELLNKLASRFNLRMLVISDRDLSIPGVEVENRRWSEATEVNDILDMDIGVMPMPDDPWSRGKCGFKAIQYMAAGIPPVCAAVGANLEIVRDGVDGYCVSNKAQWLDRLSALCANVELRALLGSSARQRVQAAYSLEAVLPLWLSSLREAMAGQV